MNATEQRARHSAVANAEKRLDNLEIVVEALAKEMVTERGARIAAIAGTRAACDTRQTDAMQRFSQIFHRSARVDNYTLWDRLRWIAIGR